MVGKTGRHWGKAEIESRLRPIFAKQLGIDPERVVRTANLIRDLEADSLGLVELIISIEEEFKDENIEISDEDAEKVITFGDAVDLADELLNN